MNVAEICMTLCQQLLPKLGKEGEVQAFSGLVKRMNYLKGSCKIGNYFNGHSVRACAEVLTGLGWYNPPLNDFVFLAKKDLRDWFFSQSEDDQAFIDKTWGSRCRGFAACMLMDCPSPPSYIVNGNHQIQRCTA